MNLQDEMREWLLEYFSSETCQEEINELTMPELIRAVDRYYDGGVKAFCNGWSMVEA